MESQQWRQIVLEHQLSDEQRFDQAAETVAHFAGSEDPRLKQWFAFNGEVIAEAIHADNCRRNPGANIIKLSILDDLEAAAREAVDAIYPPSDPNAS